MHPKTSTRLALLLTCVLAACGGGGGGGSSGPAESTAPPAVQSAPATLVVTFSSLPANALGADPREGLYLVFNNDLGSKVLTPNLVQLTDGANVVPSTITASGQTLTVTPTSPLKLRTDYTLTLKAGFAGTSSVLASNYVLPFKTDVVVFDTLRVTQPNPALGTTLPIAVGDFNGDGRADILELGTLQNHPVSVFPPTLGYTINFFAQNAQGGFDKVQQIDFVTSTSLDPVSKSKIVLLDIDGDGVPEVLVPEYGSIDTNERGLRIFGRQTDGQFKATGFVPIAYLDQIIVADVDGDGRLDLIGGASGNLVSGFQVLLNHGARSASVPAGLLAMPIVKLPDRSVVLGALSINSDGTRQIIANIPEIVALDRPSLPRIFAYSQGARGLFSADPALTEVLVNVCVGLNGCNLTAIVDIDGDGLPDLMFEDISGKSVGYVRRGGGFVKAFEESLYGIPYVVDFDRDGLADLLIVGGNGGAFVAAAAGNRSTRFLYSTRYPVPLFDYIFSPAAAAVIDVNGDGLPDIVMDQYNSGIYVMLQHKY